MDRQMNVFIVHGYMAHTSKHWFPWLSQRLRQQGHRVTVVELPTPDSPVREQWVDQLIQVIGVPSQQTIIIGHSLGGCATLYYLQKLSVTYPQWVLGGLVMVASFAEPLVTLPELDTFLAAPLTPAQLAPSIEHTCMIYSDADSYVHPQVSQRLASLMGAHEEEVLGAGHFLDADEVPATQVILTTVENIIAQLQT